MFNKILTTSNNLKFQQVKQLNYVAINLKLDIIIKIHWIILI